MLLRPSGVLGRRRGVPNIVHARRCGPAATQQQSRCNSGGFASRKAIIAMLRRAPPGRPVRRRWPAAPGARLGACPGSAAAGDGQARPGRRRPPRAIEALPVAMSLPGTSSGLPARPAAPGELAVPISSSTAPAAAGGPVRRRWPSSSSAPTSPFGVRSGLPSCTWCAPGISRCR